MEHVRFKWFVNLGQSAKLIQVGDSGGELGRARCGGKVRELRSPGKGAVGARG